MPTSLRTFAIRRCLRQESQVTKQKKKPTEHQKLIARRKQRARNDPTKRTVERHILRCRARAANTTPKIEAHLKAHANRCADELPLALLLTREWALEATGTGPGSDIADPTGNAALNTHHTLWGALTHHLNSEWPTDQHAINNTIHIDHILDAVDVFQHRVLDMHDRTKLWAENQGQGECDLCDTIALGTRGDRLTRLSGTQHNVCSSCRKAWTRARPNGCDIDTWAANRKQNRKPHSDS